ncbi:cyclase family protein [Nonomuraea ferruginea]
MGREQNELVSYSGDAISMYTHCGTHIDTLNHFGYNGRIWNGFSAEEHISSRHWTKCGAEKIPRSSPAGCCSTSPPCTTPTSCPTTTGSARTTCARPCAEQNVEFRPGDVALIRTGRMRAWPAIDAYIDNSPGLNLEGAEFLARMGASVIGGDTLALEQMPGADEENWQVVHTYLLGEAGVPIMEVADCEQISAERLYEFAFVAAAMKLRGATGAPMRPLAMPLRP